MEAENTSTKHFVPPLVGIFLINAKIAHLAEKVFQIDADECRDSVSYKLIQSIRLICFACFTNIWKFTSS